jgi:aerobic carbon-monoxide dehydrogenase large subunit
VQSLLRLGGRRCAATDAAFAKAHHIAKIDLVNNRLVPNAMESRAALAEYEPATGDYTPYTSTQLPHVARVLIGVLILGIPERKLRVVAPDVGGGFDSKQVVYAEEGLVTGAAHKLERLVDGAAHDLGIDLGIDRVEIRGRNFIPLNAFPIKRL